MGDSSKAYPSVTERFDKGQSCHRYALEMMNPTLRSAVGSDVESLVEMRELMFADMRVNTCPAGWRAAAREWFTRAVDQPSVCLVVVEENDLIVSCGMVELHAGAPGPTCPTGRTAHLSSPVTKREARGRGLASQCLTYLLEWSAERADRAELHASDHGDAMYRRVGFEVTPNPSMRLTLTMAS